MTLPKEITDDLVGRICGVEPTDSVIEAANKVIKVMREVGFPQETIKEAERLRDAAIAHGVK